MTIDNDQIETVRVRVLPDGRMTRPDAALYLGVEVKTLAMWALKGKGPRLARLGGRVFYHKADLDMFILSEANKPAPQGRKIA